MHLPRPALDLIARYARDPRDAELEVVCKLVLDAGDVRRWTDSISARAGVCRKESATLDVSLGSGCRLSIEGADGIYRVCDAIRCCNGRLTLDDDVVDAVVLVRKPLASRRSAPIGEDNEFVLRLSEETVTPGKDIDASWLSKAVVKRLTAGEPMFRLKRRVSHFDADRWPSLRVDVTAVRTASRLEALPYEAVTYELEFEAVRANADALARDAVDCMNEVMRVVCAAGHPSQCPVTDRRRRAVVASYLEAMSIDMTADAAVRAPKKAFVGPQPITLERKHLSDDADSVWSGYTVTDKADGDRALLYVDENGSLYLVNNRMGVRRVMTSCAIDALPARTVLDGEYITRWREDQTDLAAFAVFDVYLYGGIDVMATQTLRERLAYVSDGSPLEEPHDILRVAETLWVFRKAFRSTDERGSVAACLDAARAAPYHTDGLVFTPSHLAVGELYAGGGPARDGTWIRVFKWKPPEDNTIDFLVRRRSSSCSGYDLCVGGTQDDPVTAFDVLSSAIDPAEFAARSSYKAIPFAGHDGLPSPVYMGQDVRDHGIYEFAFDRDRCAWTPKRLRSDKTELYFRQDRRIGGTANDYDVALQVWSTITDPIREDDLRDHRRFSTVRTVSPDVYYRRGANRARLATKRLMDAHNLVVKGRFVFDALMRPWIARERPTRLMDLACGRSGDADRWRAAGIDHVLGIDGSRDNIEGAKEGAYARLLNKRNVGMLPTAEQRRKYVYVAMDLTKDIRTAEDALDALVEPMRSSDRVVVQHLWGVAFERMLGDDAYGFAAPGSFDIASCHFAIHYLWPHLDVLLDTVDHFLRPGGLFVGTCLDGRRVVEALRTSADGATIQRTVRSPPNPEYVLWRVHAPDGRPRVGGPIDVYMESIGHEMREYLVDLEDLSERLARKGYRPHCIRSFENVPGMTDALAEAPDLMAYSRLNACFAFVKGSS